MLKTKKFRRLLAGLLAVLMLSICVPAMAFAAGGEEARVLNVTFSYTDEDSNQYYGKTYTFDEAKTSMVVPDAAAIGVTVDGDYYWYTDVYSKEDTLHAGDVKNILDYNDYDGEYITYNLKVVEADKPKVHTFMVSFVDAEQGEVKKVGPIEMGYSGDFTYAGFCEDYAGQGVKLPDGYELAEPNENFKLTADTTEVVILIKPTTQTVGVNYWDVENDKQAAEGEVTVPADATNVNSSALTDIPEGYELVWTGDFPITDGWIYVEVKPIQAGPQEIGVNYWDVINNKQVYEGTVTVDAGAYNVNSSLLTDIPEGYELVWTGDFQINDGWIWVEVRPVPRTVGVNYWDVEANKQVCEGEVTVDDVDATHVNSSALTDIPEGYELVWTGDFQINDGWVWVEVRPVATTQTVGVNYWDVENDKQAAEGEVTVPADATNVNSSALTDIPEGYELVWTGDFQINDGWIYVEVRPAVTMQTVGVNYWDVENDKQAAEGEVTVPADATNVNSSALTDIPEGYELVWTGDFQIMDGWIYVEVRPVATTQIVGVNYWDIINNKQVTEGEVTVAADAWKVNSSELTDIPENYELVWTGDFQIMDGWIYVEVRPATRTVGLNYWDIVNNEQVAEGSVEVPMSENIVNTSTFTDIPEGYELVWTGDLQIMDGWVWVEVRPIKTLRIYWAIDNGDAADFADGNADSYTQELTWKHIHDDIDMPELTIADGYKLAGWTVGGKNSEYWDADLATTNVGDRFVEDENGGIISITANVVADSTPTTPSTGDNTSTATGDTHPDIAEGIANGTWGAAPAASSDPAAATSTIPQTSDNLPLAALVIVAVVAAGAVCGLVVLRKRSNQ